jgi:hypothetical protein
MNQKGIALTALIALILGITIAGAAAYIVIHSSFFSQSPLSSARDLVGTWRTSFSTKFYIATDFDTGTLQDIGSEDRQVTWTITATEDESVVDIEQSFTESNRQLTGGGYVPDVSPNFYTGTISSSSLTVNEGDRVVGYFAFTTDIITGTWSDNWAMAFTQDVYTAINGLTLTRQ